MRVSLGYPETEDVARRELLVTGPDELNRVAEGGRAAGRIGLDTEFLREKTYRARLCLVQVATPESIAVIDPLRLDVSQVAGLVADPGVEVVVHAGKQDFEILHDHFGVLPGNVFDVQIAAGFAGYGASLPYGRLVESVVGATLSKGESYTDWCRRPLTAAQLQYAADDVRFLLPLADRLKHRLGELARTVWAREEMRPMEEPGSYGIDPERAWRRVPGKGALTGRQTAVLKEVAAWRERAASRRDLPRGWLVKDPTLVEIARKQPRNLSSLKSIRGLNAREAERSGRDIIASVERAQASPGIDQGAKMLPREVVARAKMLSGLVDAIVRARCDRARVATELVSNRAEMESLLTEIFSGTLDESRHRLLQGWRRDLAGDSVMALVQGRIAVRAIDSPPYVEEVAT